MLAGDVGHVGSLGSGEGDHHRDNAAQLVVADKLVALSRIATLVALEEGQVGVGHSARVHRCQPADQFVPRHRAPQRATR
jgi:hypothetical protein